MASQILVVLSRDPEMMQSLAVVTARTSREWPVSSVASLKSSILRSILASHGYGFLLLDIDVDYRLGWCTLNLWMLLACWSSVDCEVHCESYRCKFASRTAIGLGLSDQTLPFGLKIRKNVSYKTFRKLNAYKAAADQPGHPKNRSESRFQVCREAKAGHWGKAVPPHRSLSRRRKIHRAAFK